MRNKEAQYNFVRTTSNRSMRNREAQYNFVRTTSNRSLNARYVCTNFPKIAECIKILNPESELCKLTLSVPSQLESHAVKLPNMTPEQNAHTYAFNTRPDGLAHEQRFSGQNPGLAWLSAWGPGQPGQGLGAAARLALKISQNFRIFQ